MPRKRREVNALILVAALATAASSGNSCTANEIGQGGGNPGSEDNPETCADSIRNGAETDVDCGGDSCPTRCADGRTCGVDSDCASTFCNQGVCVAQCDNAVKDGDETGVDCGGSCVEKCADGMLCAVAADCQSGARTGNVCSAPTCVDEVHNGTETDLDCGGSCAAKCSVGRDCKIDGDCASGACMDSRCVPDPKSAGCFDALQNNLETAVDCGGGACAGCKFGDACILDSDCVKTLKCGGNPGMTTCQVP